MLVAGLLVCALPTSGASAARIATQGFGGTPALSGDAVLWTELTRGGSVELWSFAPGGAAERQQLFPLGGRHMLPTLAASATRALLSTFESHSLGGDFVVPRAVEHFTGRSEAQLEPLGECLWQGDPLRSADVWNDAIAYRSCEGRASTVEVRDFAAVPLSPARTVPTDGFAVRIAGRYVAWLESETAERYERRSSGPPDIVVYDRVDGAEVYRVSRSALTGAVYALDVQEDGKVAFSYARADSTKLAVGWASAAEPWIHPLSIPAHDNFELRLAGDRIAFQTGPSLKLVVPRAHVGIADLEGNVEIVARATHALVLAESFDYDGSRVAWRELGCERRWLVVRDASAPAAEGPMGRCPLRLRGKASVRRGRVTLRLSCGSLPEPCAFRVKLRTRGLGVVGKTRSYDENPVRLPLSPAARDRLAAVRTLTVRATAHLLGGYPYEETRSAKIRIRTR